MDLSDVRHYTNGDAMLGSGTTMQNFTKNPLWGFFFIKFVVTGMRFYVPRFFDVLLEFRPLLEFFDCLLEFLSGVSDASSLT